MVMPNIDLSSTNVVATGGLPLVEFIGVLEAINYDVSDNNQARVKFQFNSVEVIESDPGTAWPYPLAELNLRYNQNKDGKLSDRSPLGSLINSAAADHGMEVQALVTQRLHLKATLNPITDRETQAISFFKTWSILEIIQDVVVDPEEELLNLVDGKQAAEIIRALSSSVTLKGYVNDSLDGSLFTQLVADSKVTQNDDGSYSRVST